MRIYEDMRIYENMVIFKQAIQRICKNKLRLSVILVMPIIFILMFTMQKSATLTIGIVDKDNSYLSNQLINNLRDMDKVKVELLDEGKVYDKTVSYGLDYSIIIDKGFQEKIVSGGDAKVEEFYITPKEKLYYARTYIDSFINNMKILASGAAYDKTKFMESVKKYEISSLSVKNVSKNNDDSFGISLAIGFLIQFMLYTSVITAGLILEDKASGVFYRVFYAPIKVKRYLFENLIAYSVIAIAQVILILLFINKVMGKQLGSTPINMYILFSVFSLVCISLGLFLVSLSKKPIYAYMIIFTITTPLLMLGGCYWDRSIMPEAVNKLSLFLPTTWVMDGAKILLSGDKGLPDILLQILVLLIFAVIFFAAGLLKKVDVSK